MLVPEFNVGDKVVILDGLYQDTIGTVQEVVLEARIVLYMIVVSQVEGTKRVLVFTGRNIRPMK